MQNQPSMAVCIYSDLHVGIGSVPHRVLRTSKLLPKVAICINIFRYTYQVSILFDHNIICFEYQKVTLYTSKLLMPFLTSEFMLNKHAMYRYNTLYTIN